MFTTKTANGIVPEEVFPQVEKMLYKLAWRTSQTYPVTFEEARSEAYYAFMRSCSDYKPDSKAKFSTWCYFWVWTHLKTFVTKRSTDPLTFIEIEEEVFGEAPPVRSDVVESLKDLTEPKTLLPWSWAQDVPLSQDAKEIIMLLLESPAEVLDEVVTVRQLLTKVKKYLVAKGKKKEAVEKATNEIRLRFQTTWA